MCQRLPGLRLRLHLEVGERGHAARAPVDDVVAAVDEALLVAGARRPRARRATRPASMVKRSRVQSSEKPIRRSCWRILPPLCSFHSRRAPRTPRGRGPPCVFPSFASWRSTTICVAMPAWSRPGSQSASKPLMRFQRTITSCSVCVNAWPMCSEPVTLGGGMHDRERRLAGSRVGAEEALLLPERVPARLHVLRLVGLRQRFGHVLTMVGRQGRGPASALPGRSAPRPAVGSRRG